MTKNTKSKKPDASASVPKDPEINPSLKITKPSYWCNNGKFQKLFDWLFGQLVPETGRSQTPHGELLRCVVKLYYDLHNNGFCNARNPVFVYALGVLGQWAESIDSEARLLGYRNSLKTYLSAAELHVAHLRASDDMYVPSRWTGTEALEEVMDAVIVLVSGQFYEFDTRYVWTVSVNNSLILVGCNLDNVANVLRGHVRSLNPTDTLTIVRRYSNTIQPAELVVYVGPVSELDPCWRNHEHDKIKAEDKKAQLLQGTTPEN